MSAPAPPYPRVVTTDRLELSAVCAADLTALHVLHADASTWRHFPAGRHTDIEETRIKLDSMIERWAADGLGYWSVRVRADDGRNIIGIAGAQVSSAGYWNLYYRFAPSAWGFGYAAEAARAGVLAAAELDPSRAVVASLLSHNLASRRTAEHSGLTLRVDVPVEADRPDGAHRLIFADRDVSATIATRGHGD